MTQTLTACRTAGCTAPETADHATLHRTGGPHLLRAFASLTHRIDRVGMRGWEPAVRVAAEADLRAQRDLIEAEILRRMGGQS